MQALHLMHIPGTFVKSDESMAPIGQIAAQCQQPVQDEVVRGLTLRISIGLPSASFGW